MHLVYFDLIFFFIKNFKKKLKKIFKKKIVVVQINIIFEDFFLLVLDHK